MGMGGGLPRKCNLKLFLTWGRVLSKINDVIKKHHVKNPKGGMEKNRNLRKNSKVLASKESKEGGHMTLANLAYLHSEKLEKFSCIHISLLLQKSNVVI